MWYLAPWIWFFPGFWLQTTLDENRIKFNVDRVGKSDSVLILFSLQPESWRGLSSWTKVPLHQKLESFHGGLKLLKVFRILNWIPGSKPCCTVCVVGFNKDPGGPGRVSSELDGRFSRCPLRSSPLKHMGLWAYGGNWTKKTVKLLSRESLERPVSAWSPDYLLDQVLPWREFHHAERSLKEKHCSWSSFLSFLDMAQGW